jgi:hypothetical protein
MNPDTVIQLRKQLEAIREFERKNTSGKYSYAGFWAEFLVGIAFLGELIAFNTYETQTVARVAYFVVGAAMTFQGLYLIIRFKMDKRIKLLLEAMLTIGDTRSL